MAASFSRNSLGQLQALIRQRAASHIFHEFSKAVARVSIYSGIAMQLNTLTE